MKRPAAAPPQPLRIKGHKLEMVSVRGGIIAACTCGESYRPATGVTRQCFPTWDKPKIRQLHQAHLQEEINK